MEEIVIHLIEQNKTNLELKAQVTELKKEVKELKAKQ
jgi:hypothetical protein